jgi:hypothetical protein
MATFGRRVDYLQVVAQVVNSENREHANRAR